ncbi:MAG: hypothetical protein A2W25_01370 [candidate division Zixibacteria bacterium RBG_16_53_22]|nr:MAG: hypothetical protein A2W25_01370 [candidate division Zixibacteria bacterium RBG_16_53_22]
MNSEIAISVRNVSKKFRLFSTSRERLAEALHPFRKQYHKEFWALRDVSFEVGRGEIVGILGRNGSGKSTLLQIICGVMQETAGKVVANGRISALLELGAGFNSEFTGRENVILNGAIHGFSRRQMLERMDQVEAFADIGEFFDQPVKTYSSGMFVRTAFASAIHVDPEILIVDEALSVGDIKFQEKCFRKLNEFREARKTIVLVTHETARVEQFCSRALVLEGAQVAFTGDPQEAVSLYESLLFPRKNVVIDQARTRSDSLARSVAASSGSVKGGGVSPAVKTQSGMNGPGRELLRSFFSLDSDQDRCKDRRSYNKYELRFGDGGGAIVDYLLVNGDDEDFVSIPSGTRFYVYIKVLGLSGIKWPSVGVGVFTHTGQMVCSGNAGLLSVELQLVQPGSIHFYKIGISAILAEGEYFLHFGLTESVEGKIIRHDARRSVAVFRVTSTPWIEGLVDLAMSLEEIGSISDEGKYV